MLTVQPSGLDASDIINDCYHSKLVEAKVTFGGTHHMISPNQPRTDFGATSTLMFNSSCNTALPLCPNRIMFVSERSR